MRWFLLQAPLRPNGFLRGQWHFAWEADVGPSRNGLQVDSRRRVSQNSVECGRDGFYFKPSLQNPG